jgi:autotransporter-associated beta strand protein
MSLGSGALIDVQSGATLYNGGWGAFTWTANLADLKVDGTLNLADGNNVTVDALTGAGSITAITAGRTLIVGVDNDSGVFSGVIQNGSGTINLTKNGTGTQTLSGTNTYTGFTTISSGTLDVSGSGSLGAGNYAGAITNNGAFNYSSSANQTLSGVISGTGSVTKAGASTLTLTGVNTYTGPVVVSNGTLIVHSALGSGAVTVDSGSTLGGTGVIAGAVTQNGTVSPGQSIGTLTVSNQLTCSGTAVTRFELGGTNAPADYDRLVVSDLHALAGSLEVVATNGYVPASGDQFTLIQNTALGGLLSDAFATTNLPALAPGLGWEILETSESLTLAVTGTVMTATPYDLWAQSITNPALRGESEDADGDGLANLWEYSQGTEPTTGVSGSGVSIVWSSGLPHLKFNRVTGAVDIVYEVEASYGFNNAATWTVIASNALGTGWGGLATVFETNSGPVRQVFTGNNDLAATNRGLRVRVTRP